ncbi:MAG: 8-amino-7-oxononanoate synthase, partial [Bacteroidota bacterium]|nr:8-amino-7-oxononanoate synthase [Bacteroidota bacterium]
CDTSKSNSALKKLRENIQYFREELKNQQLEEFFIKSDSAIHCAILPGNALVKQISTELLEAGFDVKAILSPTVPAGQERLRICLHSYNSQNEIKTLLELLAKSLE